MLALIQQRAFSYHEQANTDPRRVTVVRSDQLEEMVRRCQAAPHLAADTETSGLRWDLDARIVGNVFSCFREDGSTQSYYLPFRHRTGEVQIPEDTALRAITDVYHHARPDQQRHWWNRKFDDHILRREGIRLTDDRDSDAMLDARLYDENTGAALKDRAVCDLGELDAHVYEQVMARETVRLATLHGLRKEEYVSRFGYSQIPIFMAGQYGCRDGDYTLRLAKKYADLGVTSYYSRRVRGPQFYSLRETEQRLARVLCDVEEWGIKVDRAYLGWLKLQTVQAAERIESEIWESVGAHRKFNLDSDDELRHFLVNVLRIDLHKRTRGGVMAVDREVLESFAEEHPVLHKIRDRREARKISTTYTDSLLEWADANDIIHGNYKQHEADTGRASMEKPNLQNQGADSDARAVEATGKKLEDGGRDPWSIRRGFPVRPGHIQLFIDWSQIELRVLADETQDANLLAAYRAGEDLHDQTTKLMFGAVTKAKRKVSKMANFGDAFGLTPMGLARRAKITLEEAEAFTKRRNEVYPGIDQFRRRLWAQARANGGWFENKFGRTRRIPELLSPDEHTRGRSERQTVATRIQGTAGDMSKYAMVMLDGWLKAEGLRTRIAGWIHDEIRFDVPPEEFAYVTHGATAIMQHFPDFSIPIRVSREYSVTNWSEKQKVPE